MSKSDRYFVVCIDNSDYPASLERRKIYEAIQDSEAAKHDQIRVVDESGEDYLYSESLFVPIKLPKDTEDAVFKAA
jgi:hypothetical protein